MSDAYIGEIRMFGGNFAPDGWYFCMGQTLAIASEQTLFSVIGNYFGGDGRANFRLPDLRGIAPLHWGNSQGPGLSSHYLGQQSGSYEKMINADNMPAHTHSVGVENSSGTTPTPGETSRLALAEATVGPIPQRARNMYSDYDQQNMVQLNPAAVNSAGPSNGEPIYLSNYQPYQTCSFIINSNGIYPPRS